MLVSCALLRGRGFRMVPLESHGVPRWGWPGLLAGGLLPRAHPPARSSSRLSLDGRRSLLPCAQVEVALPPRRLLRRRAPAPGKAARQASYEPYSRSSDAADCNVQSNNPLGPVLVVRRRRAVGREVVRGVYSAARMRRLWRLLVRARARGLRRRRRRTRDVRPLPVPLMPACSRFGSSRARGLPGRSGVVMLSGRWRP